VLSGVLRVNDEIQICALAERRKIKSMQMFRRSVAQCLQGDRVGVCVTQFDADKFERGL
jgi:selenocysteine-specific elongation factor